MSKKVQNKFKLSFVMPVYNVEDYLYETVESILSQTMDFTQNCEIVFVNDGSIDGSEEICLQYKDRYPDNIQYFKQKNQGVSAARNLGVKNVRGEFISFLDSDDKISSDTASEVYRFFAQHSEIDVVSIKMQWFDAAKGQHTLNKKFHTTRVVDIKKEHSAIQLSGGSSFVRTSAAQKHQFDRSLKYGEDAKYLTELIAEKGAYGVLKNPTYFYRKRPVSSSALNKAVLDKDWYEKTVNEFHQSILADKKRAALLYVQYVIMYDLQWRYMQRKQTVLDKTEAASYKAALDGVLAKIDDEVIAEQLTINNNMKMALLHSKNGQLKDYWLKKLFDENAARVYIDILEFSNDTLLIEGYVQLYEDINYDVLIQQNSQIHKAVKVHRPYQGMRSAWINKELSSGFRAELPLDSPDNEIKLQIVTPGKSVTAPLATKRMTGLNPRLRLGYCIRQNMLVYKDRVTIKTKPYGVIEHVKHELMYEASMFQKLKIPSLLYRWAYYASKPFIPKGDIWILSDRNTEGGDNGEALFRHIMAQPNTAKTKNIYFSLLKSSPDYERLKKYGPVLSRGSLWYKMMFLSSSMVVSSHADDFVINPFGGRFSNLCDLYRFKFVFLQHGITKDDISEWINRYDKNIRLMVTAAKPEYRSILEGDYAYTSRQIVLSGFPRFDLLTNSTANKKLILAPTWRDGVLAQRDDNGLRAYSAAFKNTEYFKFYNGLIKDKRIRKALRDHNLIGELYLHPAFAGQAKDFTESENFRVKTPPYNYKEAFRDGTVLVTDYSSVAFDFAYLKKPVVYTQFDHDDFFQSHGYAKGYYDYGKDGFGPVTSNFDEAVVSIVAAIEADGQMPKQYEKRVDAFFAFTDKHNSQRVLDAIDSI